MANTKHKLSEAQLKILQDYDLGFYYDKLSVEQKAKYISCVKLHKNHRSAYKLEELGYGITCCIQPFDYTFFLRFKNSHN